MPKSSKSCIESNNNKAKLPNYANARKTAIEGVRAHGKAEKTKDNYLGHIRRGKQYLEQFVLEESEAKERWNTGQSTATNLRIEGEDRRGVPDEENSEARMPPHFQEAFSGTPIECTPLAISMFIAFKCYTQNCSKSTASAIHAAFLQHYNHMDGDKYRGKWHFDHHTREWVGNPVRSAAVDDQIAACRNKDGEGERKHSRAITIEDMRCLLQFSHAKFPSCFRSLSTLTDQRKEIAERGNFLFFNALSTSAFTIWMRVGEVTSLQYKNFEFPCGRDRSGFKDGPHYFKLNLRNRKNWQKREKNGEHQLNGHMYMIYGQEQTPEIDMHAHLLDWLEFYERFLLGRPLQPNDHIFPTIGANGLSVQPDRAMTPDIAQKRINQMAKDAGVNGAQSFTTHCFRRGGAQYRFMFAPLGERWTLARIRWWGGWATGEHRDTLIRYLLDELYTYEEDHSNALCPEFAPTPGMDQEHSLSQRIAFAEVGLSIDLCLHRLERGGRWHGYDGGVDGLLESIYLLDELYTYEEDHSNALCPEFAPTPGMDQKLVANSAPPIEIIQGFTRQVTQQISTIQVDIKELKEYRGPLLTHAYLGATHHHDPTFHQRKNMSLSVSPSPSISNPARSFTFVHSRSINTSVSTTTTTSALSGSDVQHLIPMLPRKLGSTAFEQVVTDWDYADHSRSLYVPMKDWKPEWHKSTGQSQKYGQRQTVAIEFINYYNRDKAAFTAAYPEHRKGFTPLLNAIRQAQKMRGDCGERQRYKP